MVSSAAVWTQLLCVSGEAGVTDAKSRDPASRDFVIQKSVRRSRVKLILSFYFDCVYMCVCQCFGHI